MRSALSVLVFLFAATLSAGSAIACEDAVRAHIAKLGITPGQITGIAVSNLTGGGEGRPVFGYAYWIGLESCPKGYLVVDTDKMCTVVQAYTMYDCKVPGVR